MSANKSLVEGYFRSTGTEYSKFLADDVELIEWAPGVPESGAITRGKAAYVGNRGSRSYRVELTRLTEEGNVVVAEGTARGTSKEGVPWTVRFCDVFEIADGRVTRMSSFGADVQGPG